MSEQKPAAFAIGAVVIWSPPEEGQRRCDRQGPSPAQFSFTPEELAAASSTGDVVAIVTDTTFAPESNEVLYGLNGSAWYSHKDVRIHPSIPYPTAGTLDYVRQLAEDELDDEEEC